MPRSILLLSAIFLSIGVKAQTGYDVTWTDVVGATSTSTSVTKTASTGWGNSGAVSLYFLRAGTDGWLEYTVDEINKRKCLGFSDYNANNNHYSIEYNFFIGTNGNVYMRNDGVDLAFEPVSVGDVLRLERQGSSIIYKINGVTKHTVTGGLTIPLIADAALYENGSSISGMKVSFGPPASSTITWTGIKGVSFSDNNDIMNIATVGYGNSAAVSSGPVLQSGQDGWVSVIGDEGDKARVFGLTATNHDDGNNIDFAFSLGTNSNINVVENGVQKTGLGTFAPGTPFWIAREGTQIKYFVDGIHRYTSATSSTGDLYADVGFYTSNATLKQVNFYTGSPVVIPEVTTNVTWKEIVGCVLDSEGYLSKIWNITGYNSGAVSYDTLPAGQDGYVEMVADEINTLRAFGLASANVDAGLTIEFALQLKQTQLLSVYEDGVFVADVGYYSQGTVLRIGRESGQVKYYINGVLKYTSAKTSTSSLMVDVSLSYTNATIKDVTVSFPAADPPVNTFWKDLVGVVAENGNDLRKTANYGYGNAGAVSRDTLPAGQDGWMEMTVAETDLVRTVGLSSSNINNGSNIDFAFEFSNSGTVSVKENDVLMTWVGSCVTGDVFRVSREGTQIKYYKNGSLLYTSTKTSTSALIVDAGFMYTNATIKGIQTSFSTPQGGVQDLEELHTLKDVYDSLGGTNWTTKTNWPAQGSWPSSATSEEFGTWHGVTVRDGDVVAIELTQNNIAGKLPASIGDLLSLDTLDLHSNNLSGSIPTAVGALEEMKYLDLSTNNISGTIPSSIANLSVLKVCKLSQNMLTGAIPASIGTLDDLTTVDLSDNQFTAMEAFDISELTQLTSFNIASNLIDFSDMENFAGSSVVDFGPQKEIPMDPVEGYLGEQLVLQARPLGEYSSVIWERQEPDESWLNVTTLNEDETGETFTISDVTAEYEGDYRWRMTNTEIAGVELQSTPFEVTIIPLYDPGIRYPLKDFYDSLGGAYWTDKTGWPTPGNWPASPTVNDFSTWDGVIVSGNYILALELFNNNLSGVIPSTLWDLKDFQVIRLDGNNITGMTPGDYTGIGDLYELDLSDNQITALPDNFGELSSIQNLYLQDNQLTSLPESFGDLYLLYELVLSNNKLKSLPESFGYLGFLQSAYLNNNELETLPEDLSSLNAVTMDLASNKLRELPSDFHWVTFSDLDLSNNELTTIPELDYPPFYLDVSGNYLDFGTLEMLDNLDISVFNYAPQKQINNITEISGVLGQSLVIPSRDPGQNSTIVWEKLIDDVWTNVNSLNEDLTQETFTINIAQESDLGQYRWTMTNAQLPDLTLKSGSINAREASAVFLDQWAFRYKYDIRRRMSHKKVPGADWVYMVYDDRDRLVLTQDGNQREKSPPEWTFTKYDVLNRPVLTGIYKDSENRNQKKMQEDLDLFYQTEESENGPSVWYEESGNDVHHYTNRSFPNTTTEENDYLTVTYYDDYTRFVPHINHPTESFEYDESQINTADGDFKPQDANEFPRVIGQVTGTRIKNLETGAWYYTVNYYDNRYRVIQTIMENHKDGIDKVTNVYDFVSKITRTKTSHSVGSDPPIDITRKFVYDHAGRQEEIWHKFGEEDYVLSVASEYNEIGELISKKLHSTDPESTQEEEREFKQEIDYRYNIRGWLTSVNDPVMPDSRLFSMELRYNDPTLSGSEAQYNGNISEMIWKSGEMNLQSYGYYYDTLNRIKEARYFDLSEPANNNRYNEVIGGVNVKGYDLNGNILKLIRGGKTGESSFGTMDNLTYTYNGNQLTHVEDTEITNAFENGFKEVSENSDDDEYLYDINGNMTVDKNKDIESIEYNHLNLPSKVTKSNGDYITYAYDATGKKLYQTVTGSETNTKDYIGEFFYENDELKFINHEEGRIIPPLSSGDGAGGEAEYQYHLKDHLGNVRLTFTTKEDQYTATLEPNHQQEEEEDFPNYQDVTLSGASMYNHTEEPGATTSLVLNGADGKQLGLAKSLKVNPGDVINLKVFGKYFIPSSQDQPGTQIIETVLGAFRLTDPASPLEEAAAYALSEVFNLGWFIGPQDWEDDTAPKAYLNYILFDNDFIPYDIGFNQIDHDAEVTAENPDPEHDEMTLQAVATQPGYVYIYLSNEDDEIIEVYFDDLSIEHIHAPVMQSDDYYPFGLTFNSYQQENSFGNYYLYNGKEKQSGLNIDWLDYGARMYTPELGRWGVIDPLAEKFIKLSPYQYAANDPVNLIDVNGLEPIKPQAGTALGFIKFMNSIGSRMTTLRGSAASNSMLRLGKTEFDWKRGVMPATTNPINTSKDKYIYTSKGGWLDMAHFMFYAGRAYMLKLEKMAAQKILDELKNDSKSMASIGQGMSALYKMANLDPVSEAVQEGYIQEMSDRVFAPHSAYSYEDLPSDKFGAEFGANFFDPESDLTMGEQLLNYLMNLGATDPQNAPNYGSLPEKDPKPEPPSRTNHSTEPVYTNENP